MKKKLNIYRNLARNFLWFILFSLCNVGIFAQNYLLTEEVKALFPNVQNGVWISHFNSTAIDGNKYILNLGYDEHDYRGILQNITSNEKIFIEGRYDPIELKWIGFDSIDQIKYDIIGFRKDSVIQLDIISKDRKKAMKMNFIMQNRDLFKLLDCAPFLFCKIYQAENKLTRLNLQRNEDESISGSIFLQSTEENYSLSGKCMDPFCSVSNIVLYNNIAEKKGSIVLKVLTHNSILIEGTIASEKIEEKLHLLNQIKYNCISFPEIKNPHNVKTIVIQDKAFSKFNNEQLQKVKQTILREYTNDSVSSIQTYFDLEYCNEDFVSGIYRVILKGEPFIYSQPFNYFLRSGREIQIEDFFEKEFDYNSFLNEIIAFKSEHLIKNKSEEIKNWIGTISKQNWVLREEGLVFYSSYNPNYGFAQIQVLFSEIGAKMKKNNISKRLLKG